MKKTGAQILLECLKREGVEVIFNYPGGAILPVNDELSRWDFKMILVRHEQGAVHAADGYARASGKAGVCIVTSGPGATNTVTGLATAFMDSVPVVVITGQVSTPLIGNDAFQEADIVGITRPCTKYNYLVTDVRDLATIVREAFYIAGSGRPGPVLVDLPKDIASGVTEFKYPQEVHIRGYQPTLDGHMQQIKRALNLMLKAHRPVIYAGGGVITAGAAQELTKIAEMLNIPVTTTLMGLGGFPGTHPLSLGMLGMHGTYRANMAVTDCDLLLAVGARFDDRVTGKIDAFAPKAEKIHIDIDPTSISKNVRVDVPIVGDCKRILSKMFALLQEEKGLDEHQRSLGPWHEQIEKWKNTHRLTYHQDEVIKPQYVIERIYEMTKGEAVITTEVGQNQMWTAQYYLFDHPRTLLTSGGLGTMGYGFPAAIGAQVAFPERTVIDIAGDGSIQMNIQELATAVQYKLPVKVAILNNGYLGMVRQWQELFYERRYSMTHIGNISPDFVKLAEAYGAMGLRATRPDEVVPVIREALRTPLPVLMDFVVEPEEGVYPMVPAGEAIDRMLLV
ncbi:MAG: acetolactate synthase, large subunit, biosynthetic type [Deltaproteobacteria bacterium RBG_13_52_11]|nr:MAG: acetolactate synthase, large subunit, biosynthetic type [Deltaproteobacteria bacterium RBG_13_52_11]